MFKTKGCRKWRKRFKIKKICCLGWIFWTADRLQQIANKVSQLRRSPSWRISRIYFSLSNKWKPCNGAIKSRPRNLRMALEKYFRFHWNCKQLRVEARNSMSNCEIYFPIFSETIHTIVKIFSEHGLWKCRERLLKKKKMLEFLANIFG